MDTFVPGDLVVGLSVVTIVIARILRLPRTRKNIAESIAIGAIAMAIFSFAIMLHHG